MLYKSEIIHISMFFPKKNLKYQQLKLFFNALSLATQRYLLQSIWDFYLTCEKKQPVFK